MMKICVYGLWHLGIVTTAGLLKKGYPVTGLDDFDMYELNKGHIPFNEPYVESALISGIVHFTNDSKAATCDADIIWVTFDTPIDQRDKPNSMFIWWKIMSIIPYVKDGVKIIISSQVPIGFTNRLREEICLRHPYKKIYIAYSPENLQLGNAVERFISPDRVIVGTHPDEKQYFEIFFKNVFSKNQILWMTIPSAEMTKHAINAYLALSICFANEIAQICDETGALSGEVALGLQSDKRIGDRAYVKPGDAYSGGTLARDVDVLEEFIYKSNLSAPVLSVLASSNDAHNNWIRDQIVHRMGGDLNKLPVVVFGLSYKDGTNTLRRSGPIGLCKWLHESGAVVYAYDSSIVNILDVPNYITLLPSVSYIPKDCYCVIFLKDPKLMIDDDIINKIIDDRLVIDPNGYLQPKKNGRKYFSVRRLI
jgi:UDPglucose 6-dehydrogenase